MKYTPVIIESPYAGDIERNKRYLARCKKWCLENGYSPYASHQMLTDVLDDNKPNEREKGIEAGFAFAEVGIMRIFFVDFGWSNGMKQALDHSQTNNLPFTTKNILTKLSNLKQSCLQSGG